MAETAAERAKRSPARRASGRARETGAALESHYRFVQWLVPTLEKSPRSQRFLLRLAHDLRHLDGRRYEFAARSLDETGRRIGAWMKAHRARQSPRPV